MFNTHVIDISSDIHSPQEQVAEFLHEYGPRWEAASQNSEEQAALESQIYLRVAHFAMDRDMLDVLLQYLIYKQRDGRVLSPIEKQVSKILQESFS